MIRRKLSCLFYKTVSKFTITKNNNNLSICLDKILCKFYHTLQTKSHGLKLLFTYIIYENQFYVNELMEYGQNRYDSEGI